MAYRSGKLLDFILKCYSYFTDPVDCRFELYNYFFKICESLCYINGLGCVLSPLMMMMTSEGETTSLNAATIGPIVHPPGDI
jgi:hypothetical protein